MLQKLSSIEPISLKSLKKPYASFVSQFQSDSMNSPSTPTLDKNLHQIIVSSEQEPQYYENQQNSFEEVSDEHSVSYLKNKNQWYRNRIMTLEKEVMSSRTKPSQRRTSSLPIYHQIDELKTYLYEKQQEMKEKDAFIFKLLKNANIYAETIPN